MKLTGKHTPIKKEPHLMTDKRCVTVYKYSDSEFSVYVDTSFSNGIYSHTAQSITIYTEKEIEFIYSEFKRLKKQTDSE